MKLFSILLCVSYLKPQKHDCKGIEVNLENKTSEIIKQLLYGNTSINTMEKSIQAKDYTKSIISYNAICEFVPKVTYWLRHVPNNIYEIVSNPNRTRTKNSNLTSLKYTKPESLAVVMKSELAESKKDKFSIEPVKYSMEFDSKSFSNKGSKLGVYVNSVCQVKEIGQKDRVKRKHTLEIPLVLGNKVLTFVVNSIGNHPLDKIYSCLKEMINQENK